MKNTNILYDWISNKDILKVHNELYLIKDGKKMRLNSLVLKQSRRESK